MMFGIPSNVDSGPGEKNHKANVKQPGGNTQKWQGQLAVQTATRYAENLLLKKLSNKYCANHTSSDTANLLNNHTVIP